MIDVFGGLAGDPTDQERMHRLLESAAAAQGLLDIAYRTIDSPVGPLLLAATETGLLRVAFDREDHGAVLAELAAVVSPRILRSPARLDPAVRELDEYFHRRRRSFGLSLDLRLASGFRRLVLDGLRDIDYGRTASYTTVAVGAGNPKAVRAVGSACATNPVPIIVPCHRVVRSDGSTGGYRGGPEAKRVLLALESAV